MTRILVYSIILVLMMAAAAGCLGNSDEDMPETYEFEFDVTNSSGENWSIRMPLPIHVWDDKTNAVSEVIQPLLDQDVNLKIEEVNSTQWLVYSGQGDVSNLNVSSTIVRDGPYFESGEDILLFSVTEGQDIMQIPFYVNGSVGIQIHIDWMHVVTWDIYCSDMRAEVEGATLNEGENMVQMPYYGLECA
jgi:hypothetical protein